MFQGLLELLLLFWLEQRCGVPGVAGAVSAVPSGCTPHFSPRTAVIGTLPSENLLALTGGCRMEEKHLSVLPVVFH